MGSKITNHRVFLRPMNGHINFVFPDADNEGNELDSQNSYTGEKQDYNKK